MESKIAVLRSEAKALKNECEDLRSYISMRDLEYSKLESKYKAYVEYKYGVIADCDKYKDAIQRALKIQVLRMGNAADNMSEILIEVLKD